MTQSNHNKIIVITGPTATGKTALGIALAKKLGGEIVSADSMQVYKYMDIGTAKPAAQEMCGIPHHIIDIVPPWEDYSVACYVKDAASCIDKIQNRGNLPIVVGGTGLYIDSLIRGREFAKSADPGLRRSLEARYDAIGGRAMLDELYKFDRQTSDKLHENDKKRIVRAFEVLESTGIPLSEHDAAEKALPPKFKCVKFALTYSDRALLYDTINRRVDKMIAAGLVNEVSSLFEMGVSKAATSMQAIGYKEITEVLENKTDLAAATAKIKQESTRYAKRQLTWFRRDSAINWILWEKAPDIEEAAGRVIKQLESSRDCGTSHG